MAGGNNRRDVTLGLNVDVTGEGELDGLSADLRALAKAGGDAAPELQRLADELDASTAATKQMRDAEKALAADFGKVKGEMQQRTDALKRSAIETDAATKRTAEFKAQVQAEKLALHDAGIALRAKKEALASATAATGAAVNAERDLANQARATAKASKEAADGVKKIGSVTGEAADMLRRFGPLMATAFSAQQFVETVSAQESLVRGFEQIFGSADKARAEMEYIRGTSNKLGLETQTLAKSYQSLAASTKGTALEGQATRDVFEAVARAMSTLGKSSAETDRALTAISQIASKGTASMEELRGQLGEALPGAMKAAAAGAGITVEQLVEMVSSGSVLASDILPALTTGLNKLYANGAPPQTIVSEWARLKNTITDTMVAIGEGGASKGIAKGLTWLTVGAQGVSGAFDVAGTAIGEFVAKVATGNYELGTAADLNAKYDAQLRKAAEGAGLVEKATTGATAATQAQVRAVDQAIAAHTNAAESLLAVKARYAELTKGASDYTKLLEGSASARQAESTAMVQLVNVYGSEIEKRQAATAATTTQAGALREVSRAKEAEAIIAQSHALRLQEEALKRNDATEATRKEIENAQKSAAAKRAEADQSRAVAQGKNVEAEAAKASAAAYQDNADRVYELRGAAAAAVAEVERLTAAQKAGRATDEQVADARAKAAAATLLYRDALRDTIAAADRRISTERQTAQTVQAAIAVDIDRASAMRDVAAANGDATAATALQQRATALQAQSADEAAAAARREAQAIRESADARENELRVTGQLNAEKQAEIEAMRKSADLKELEAQRADILAEKTRALAASEQQRTQVLEQQIAAEERRLNLLERQAELERRRRGVDKDGFATDKDGNRIAAGGDLNTRTGILNFLRSAGVDDEAVAKRITNDFADPHGNITYMGNPGMKKYGRFGDTISASLLRAAET
ncbi:MAG TPA: tape measure protein, partial [Burkholderiaceae bacterium]|nr:tape measure protein [Burkholderiaceae bacterium]